KNVSVHFRVNVTEERNHARIIELERLLLALGPSTEVMRQLLVAADTRPVHVVADWITVQELHSRAHLDGGNMRSERHLGLVDDRLGYWRIELLIGNGVDIDDDTFR